MNTIALRYAMRRLLDETAKTYNSNNRSINGYGCCYVSPSDSKSPGCAVGRCMTKEEKEKCLELHLNNDTGAGDLLEQLPVAALKGFPIKFLEMIQGLHDIEDNWNSGGLSSLGAGFRDAITYAIGMGVFDK